MRQIFLKRRTLLVVILLIVIGLPLGGYIFQTIGAARDRRSYPAPGRLVDVGGYRLHLNLTGEGSPTVVLDAGHGASALIWNLVQPEVAKFTQVCSYDRAGYAWSEPGKRPRTSRQIAEELHQLLTRAGLAGPYILVGHSFGGYNVRLYADIYPQEVAGVILVDATHESQRKKGGKKLEAFFVPALVRLGVARAFPSLAGWGEEPPVPVRALSLAPQMLLAYRSFYFQPESYDAIYDEEAAMNQSAEQVERAGNLGEIPLTVLTDGTGGELWLKWQASLARLSSRSKQIVVDSGHSIHIRRPDAVVSAIREMVTATRERRSAAP